MWRPKRIKLLEKEKETLVFNHGQEISLMATEISKLKSTLSSLQEKYDELSKRKENLVQLVMAFRDMEVDTGLIKITRINPDDVFLRGRK